MVPHDVNEKKQAKTTLLFRLVCFLYELCEPLGCEERAGDEIGGTRR